MPFTTGVKGYRVDSDWRLDQLCRRRERGQKSLFCDESLQVGVGGLSAARAGAAELQAPQFQLLWYIVLAVSPLKLSIHGMQVHYSRVSNECRFLVFSASIDPF